MACTKCITNCLSLKFQSVSIDRDNRRLIIAMTQLFIQAHLAIIHSFYRINKSISREYLPIHDGWVTLNLDPIYYVDWTIAYCLVLRNFVLYPANI